MYMIFPLLVWGLMKRFYPVIPRDTLVRPTDKNGEGCVTTFQKSVQFSFSWNDTRLPWLPWSIGRGAQISGRLPLWPKKAPLYSYYIALYLPVTLQMLTDLKFFTLQLDSKFVITKNFTTS